MVRTAHPAGHAHRPTPVADLDHALATAALALGVVGLVLVALDLASAGLVLGAVGMVCALVGQMVSRTRGERWADMLGLLVSFLALAVGIAQGGMP